MSQEENTIIKPDGDDQQAQQEPQKQVSEEAVQKQETASVPAPEEPKVEDATFDVPQSPYVQQAVDTPTEEAKELSLESYNYDDKAFMAALVEQAAKKERIKFQEDQIKHQQESQKSFVNTRFEQNASKYAGDHETYDSDVKDLPLSQSVIDAILYSKNGPEIHHFLGKNRGLLSRLNTLNLSAAAVEIGQIGGNLKHSQARKTSTAPNPVDTIDSAPSGGYSDKRFDPNTSMDEFYRLSMVNK